MPKLHAQTGPVTAEGKQISSRNATTHGGTSEKLIITGERREDFDALLDSLLEEYAPQTTQSRSLVEDAALARWFLWRKQRAYNAVEAALYSAQPAAELWPAEAYHQISLLDRYKTAAERSLQRTLQNLDSLCRQEMRIERHEIAVQKQEAQAQLAVARTEDALRQREHERWKAAHDRFDRPTLVQNITVRSTRYGAITQMKPTNADLLHQLERSSPYPAQQICREFYFPHGMPPEYHSFTDREEYRREKGHTIEQMLTVHNWRAIATEEKRLATGHAIPNPKNQFVS